MRIQARTGSLKSSKLASPQQRQAESHIRWLPIDMRVFSVTQSGPDRSFVLMVNLSTKTYPTHQHPKLFSLNTKSCVQTLTECATQANGRLPYGHSPLALVNEESARISPCLRFRVATPKSCCIYATLCQPDALDPKS